MGTIHTFVCASPRTYGASERMPAPSSVLSQPTLLAHLAARRLCGVASSASASSPLSPLFSHRVAPKPISWNAKHLATDHNVKHKKRMSALAAAGPHPASRFQLN